MWGSTPRRPASTWGKHLRPGSHGRKLVSGFCTTHRSPAGPPDAATESWGVLAKMTAGHRAWVRRARVPQLSPSSPFEGDRNDGSQSLIVGDRLPPRHGASRSTACWPAVSRADSRTASPTRKSYACPSLLDFLEPLPPDGRDPPVRRGPTSRRIRLGPRGVCSAAGGPLPDRTPLLTKSDCKMKRPRPVPWLDPDDDVALRLPPVLAERRGRGSSPS